jgi:hypothetical protein
VFVDRVHDGVQVCATITIQVGEVRAGSCGRTRELDSRRRPFEAGTSNIPPSKVVPDTAVTVKLIRVDHICSPIAVDVGPLQVGSVFTLGELVLVDMLPASVVFLEKSPAAAVFLNTEKVRFTVTRDISEMDWAIGESTP